MIAPVDNPNLELAANYIRYTDKHVFLTGKAGTGKSTFLRNLKNFTWKRHVVVAPTGVAAINANGVTIHSFFQLPFGPQIPEDFLIGSKNPTTDAKHSAARYQQFTREKINIIRSIDLLVIDEISMVRADLLDAIDAVLRRFRSRDVPFGGVQLLMIGDLHQLAPIAKEEEWKLLRDYYDSVYFFSCKALQKTEYVCIELTEIYRQTDKDFINLLGKIRQNKLDDESIAELQKRHIPDFKPSDKEGYITLTTHNYQARDINTYRLNVLKGKEHLFAAEIHDEFPEFNYPTDAELHIKVGAQVMFVKNDPSPLKLFYNGKIGSVKEIDDETIYVQCPDEPAPIAVTPLEWHNCRYSIDEKTKEITETIIGSFKQYPLKLAWAVTIHKSQGLTFDKVIIDAGQAFAYGQVYVALSRCRSLEGIVLSTPIRQQTLKTDLTVNDFIGRIEESKPNKARFDEARFAFQRKLIGQLFDFTIVNRRVQNILKFLKENSSHFDFSVSDAFIRISKEMKTGLIEVSGKFMAEVEKHVAANPDIEMNEPLQERIIKACNWFAPKIEDLLIHSFPDAESDNRAIKNALKNLTEGLENEVQIMFSCINECRQGFKVSTFLETRAKASIAAPARKAKSRTTELSASNVAYPELLEKIRNWRDSLAREQDVSHYMILPRQAMFEIAAKLPLSSKELLKIKGLGAKKVKKYGSQILGMIEEYIQSKGIGKTVDDSPLEVKKKEPKPKSNSISFEMFQSGKTIQQIAAERGMVVGTIESHLLQYVANGVIPVEKLVSVDKIDRITEFFSKAGDFSLGPAKATLGDDIGWGELRFVIKHLERMKAGNNEA